jgi:hypothetical protein
LLLLFKRPQRANACLLNRFSQLSFFCFIFAFLSRCYLFTGLFLFAEQVGKVWVYWLSDAMAAAAAAAAAANSGIAGIVPRDLPTLNHSS